MDISFVPTLDPGGGGVLPFPSAWSDDLLFLIGRPVKYARDQRAEADYMQWVRNSTQFTTLAALIDWSNGTPVSQPDNGADSMINISGLDLSKRHTYGWRWVVATATTKGHMEGYIDGVQLTPILDATPIQWLKFDPNSTAAPVAGQNAGAVIDVSFMVPIFGTASSCPMVLYAVRIYQKPGASNMVH